MRDDLGDGEAVVQFGELDVARAARPPSCRPSRAARRTAGKRGDVLLLIERHVVGRLRDAQNAHRLVGELARALERRQQHRGRAVADQRAIVEVQRFGDGLPFSACSMVMTLRMCASGLSAPLA